MVKESEITEQDSLLPSRFPVQMKVIMNCLQLGSTKDAYQAALHLTQEQGFDSDPISNLVVGMVFYQRWYSDLPEDLQLTDMDANGISTQYKVFMDNVYMSSNFTEGNDAHEAGPISPLKSYSDTSFPLMSVLCTHVPSICCQLLKGLPIWLLPLKLPESHENLEDAIYNHRKLQNNDYWNALKHLRVALYSTPPVIEAFHPLIQLLLLGDLVNEALDEAEKHSFDSIIQLRLQASLLEHFDGANYVKLTTCYEKILKTDPTCGESLSKLVLMHQRGEYATQNLVEMIALHLDASFGTCETWKELASGLLKLSQCEADSVSACYDGNDQYAPEYLDTCNKIPELFTNGESGNAWMFRYKYWLRRHFHYKNLTSDIASGDLELVTYKAAAGSHLYGRHSNYALKATECLEKENNMALYSVLQMHFLNSVGFCSVTTRIT